MVRTRADNCAASRKVVAARAPRKALGGASTSSAADSSPSGKGNKLAGGNPVCPRPTPDWQKGISNFFGQSPGKGKENSEPEVAEEGCSAAGSSSGAGTSSSQESGTSGEGDSD